MKKIIALLLALVMVFALVACGNTNEQPSNDPGPSSSTPAAPSNNPSTPNTPAPVAGGTILWLSNLSSGAQYDGAVNYLEAICEALGYEFEVVYGDAMNDAANNLLAVQNAMTDDVVGLISSQDGGLQSIMEEYPDLWVVGYNTDMRSVYSPDGANAAVATNEKFLGTMADGYGNGFDLGNLIAQDVIANGYKKVSIINFPVFAYPNLTEADAGFRAAIEEHNKTASEPIEIIGETTTLMFAPLEESWFLEAGRDDLDAIVGLLAGVQFVYPTMISAMANGTCSADTKLITSGFETDPDIIADIGNRITWLMISPMEAPAYAMILLDNAITGNMPADFVAQCVDSAPYTIDSAEDINNVMTKTLLGTGDPALAHISVDEVVAMCGRNNPDMTWAELVEIFQAISTDELISG